MDELNKGKDYDALSTAIIGKLHAHVLRKLTELRAWSYWDEPLRQIFAELSILEADLLRQVSDATELSKTRQL